MLGEGWANAPTLSPEPVYATITSTSCWESSFVPSLGGPLMYSLAKIDLALIRPPAQPRA